MTVKLILEFAEDERQQFEMAYRGVEYYTALSAIHNHIRQKLKYGELTEEQAKVYEDLHNVFYEVTGGIDL